MAAAIGIFAFVASEVAVSEDRKAVERCRAAKEDWYAAQDAAARARPPQGVLRRTAWCVVGHRYANQASCARRVLPETIGACEQLE